MEAGHVRGHGWDWGYAVMMADRGGLQPACGAGSSRARFLLVMKNLSS